MTRHHFTIRFSYSLTSKEVHLTSADDVLYPLVYLMTANAPGVKEAMALIRRSLINRGVVTLENLMSLRVSTPLTENEIEIG